MDIFLLAVICWHESDEIKHYCTFWPRTCTDMPGGDYLWLFRSPLLCYASDILFVDWTQIMYSSGHTYACMRVHTHAHAHTLFNLHKINSTNDEVIETFLWNYLSWSERGQTIEKKDTVISLLLFVWKILLFVWKKLLSDLSERYCYFSERYCCLYFIILFFVWMILFASY